MHETETGPGPRPWVRVIVVNYNAGPLLQNCVDALAGQTLRDFEAVVIDNASTDGSADALRLPDARFTLIRNDRNLGFAAANNIAARGCRAPWLATLNPDTVAEPTWLAAMQDGVGRYPQVCMFGATLVSAADPAVVDGFGDVLSIAGIAWRVGAHHPIATLPAHDVEAFSPCAAAALYARAGFEAVGGFDESFFCYVEDVDLGFRLRLRGERAMQLRQAIVRHHGAAIVGEQSGFMLFHSFRNRLWLLVKDMPPALLLLAVPLNVVCSLVLVLRLALGGRLQAAGAALKGLCHGLAPAKALARRRHIQAGRRISTPAVARSLVWNLYRLVRSG